MPHIVIPSLEEDLRLLGILTEDTDRSRYADEDDADVAEDLSDDELAELDRIFEGSDEDEEDDADEDEDEDEDEESDEESDADEGSEEAAVSENSVNEAIAPLPKFRWQKKKGGGIHKVKLKHGTKAQRSEWKRAGRVRRRRMTTAKKHRAEVRLGRSAAHRQIVGKAEKRAAMGMGSERSDFSERAPSRRAESLLDEVHGLVSSIDASRVEEAVRGFGLVAQVSARLSEALNWFAETYDDSELFELAEAFASLSGEAETFTSRLEEGFDGDTAQLRDTFDAQVSALFEGLDIYEDLREQHGAESMAEAASAGVGMKGMCGATRGMCGRDHGMCGQCDHEAMAADDEEEDEEDADGAEYEDADESDEYEDEDEDEDEDEYSDEGGDEEEGVEDVEDEEDADVTYGMTGKGKGKGKSPSKSSSKGKRGRPGK